MSIERQPLASTIIIERDAFDLIEGSARAFHSLEGEIKPGRLHGRRPVWKIDRQKTPAALVPRAVDKIG
ncbi:hypothetical protein [Mesorhizobium sp. INR15]|uniref:hypothetical protein n=1 Tax=Mesorhizobium sp. INR15 TaxID=2654248 RepID=UPI0018966770|nr:hypothetical protein [Mesorhizobium sp. INR15]QPC93964.1 hypothetical protein GA829_27120 [Mesorhizobium sp. INR15]